jgi:hypothetical protein
MESQQAKISNAMKTSNKDAARDLPNQCLTKFPPSVTFFDVIDVRSVLILGNLLISGIYFQNPAYMARPPFSTAYKRQGFAMDPGCARKHTYK